MRFQAKLAGVVACMIATAVAMLPQSARAQDCSKNPQQSVQTRPIPLGVSGGNIRSLIVIKGKVKGCFGGTLGSMVQDSNNVQYILSNNHVLADQNMAKSGQPIVQPGIEEVTCLQSPSSAVATFSKAVHLKFGSGTNTVDAAMAAVEPGMVDPSIMFIGPISSTLATPAIGLSVEKMGRTTCLTSGVIAGLDANLKVNYSFIKKPKLASFIDQVVIKGNGGKAFGGPGDSGSLIVTQGDCPQPVALLFAGSADGSVTIANPLGDVLTKLNVSVVGTCPVVHGATAESDLAGAIGLSSEVVAATKLVRDRHENDLMNIPGVVGTAIGSDESGQPTILLYFSKLSTDAKAGAPRDVEGTPVTLVENGGFQAY